VLRSFCTFLGRVAFSRKFPIKSDTKYSYTPEDDLGKGRNMFRRYKQQNKGDVDTRVSILFIF
jgi:hypothetical protein